MKILLIGSSNLILLNGISKRIPYFMEIAGLASMSSISIHNLAVGGTGSLFGWERVVQHQENNYDIILIDYGITDLFTRENDRNLWIEGFKGLINHLKFRFPSALIANILLGRRDPNFWPRQAELHTEMKEIADIYGIYSIDVDSHLKQPGSRAIFHSLYKDENHYTVPSGVDHVAQYCTLKLASFLINKRNPLPQISGTRDHFKIHITPIPAPPQIFSGTRFHWTASKLLINENIKIKVPGLPIGVSFVSTPESCAIHIQSNKKSCIINTATAWTQNGLLPFIVTHAPILGQWSPEIKPPTSSYLDISIIDARSRLWDESLVQNHGYPEGRAVADSFAKNKEPSVYIDKITSWTLETPDVPVSRVLN
ncbi:MAG: SGNH/GDSL hydrolase family protein [Burkholderiaceae bacterium]|jgi:hypothetical protein|nr:SGNH/GDSL hydrolase family protein [Burkholderiaceae bacterium]